MKNKNGNDEVCIKCLRRKRDPFECFSQLSPPPLKLE